jgi:acyl-CoA thioester hydrolase
MSLNQTDDESQARLEVELPLQVHGYDIDVAGIVSNIVYVRWLEDLRQAFCDAHYPTEQMLAQGFVPILGSTHIEYKRAVRFGDRVLGRIRFEGFRGQRWTFGCEILANDKLSAVATQTGAFLNLADSKIHRIPPDMIEKFGSSRPGPIRD